MQLAKALVRVGLTLASRGPWARLRGLALFTGAFVLTLGLAGLVLAQAYAHEREQRAHAIRPHTAPSMSQANALVSFRFTQLHDRPVTVILMWPLRPDAPLPPGVTHWPEPGQAVVSPAVLGDLGPSEREMFGHISEVIGPDGVEVPQERRVYLRPTAGALETGAMEPITGFGGRQDDAGYGVGVLYATPGWQVYALIGAGLIAPGLVALALAAGLDGEARERRTRLLTAMGAGRRQRAIVDLAEAGPAVVAGAAVAGLVLIRVGAADIVVGQLDARLSATDARSAWPLLVAALLLAPVMALSAVLLVRLRPRWRRPRSMLVLDQRRQGSRAGLCLLAALATVWLPAQSQSASVQILTYSAGAILVAITLPALVGVLLSGVGEAVAGWGLSRGSAGSLLGGRRLERFPRRTARLALGVCFGVLILGQIQLWTSQLGEQYSGALAVREQLGDTIAIAGHTSYSPAMQRYLDQLPSSVAPVWLAVQPPSEDPAAQATTQVIAPCAGLQALGLECGPQASLPAATSPALTQLLRWAPNVGNVHITRGDSPDLTRLQADQAQLLLVSTRAEGLPIIELQRRAYATVPGGLQLDTLGQGWVTSGQNLIIRAGWTVALGAIGVLCLIVATACAMAGDVITSGRNLAPLAVLTGRRRWLIALTCWRTALPLVMAGTLGAGLYLVLPTGLSLGTYSMTPSVRLAISSVIGSAAMGALLAAWSAHQILRTSREWRPSSSA